MVSKATTVAEYLAALPADRRKSLQAVRKVIRANLDKGYAEGMQYGMIGYYVPHSAFPAGYHCDPKQPLPFACLAAQKNHLTLHLMCLGAPEFAASLRAAWAASGAKKLDMGKACIRFRSAEDLALDAIGAAIRRLPARKYIEWYTSVMQGRGKPAKKKAATKKAPAKKATGRAGRRPRAPS